MPPASPPSHFAHPAHSEPQTLVILRPEREALRWKQQLSALSPHLNIEVFPLLDIRPVGATTPATGTPPPTAPNLSEFDLLFFVSPSAVEHFPAATNWELQHDQKIWVTGAGTARRLIDKGVAAHQIILPQLHEAASAQTPESFITAVDPKPQFDTQTLWEQFGAAFSWQGQRILAVMGQDEAAGTHKNIGLTEANAKETDTLLKVGVSGAKLLIKRWQAAGACVTEFIAYERAPAVWDVQRLAALRALCQTPKTWLATSSQALRHLRVGAELADADANVKAVGAGDIHVAVSAVVCAKPNKTAPVGHIWPALQQHRVICTHPKIYATAQSLDFLNADACQPTVDSVLLAATALPHKL